MNYLYHMQPEHMEGGVLYPLNQLKNVSPELYTAHVAKYYGREHLLEDKIPTLDCLWNDALHFTAVHPSKIREELRAAGYDTAQFDKTRWYKVPLSLLDHSLTAVFRENRSEGGKEYEPLDDNGFSSLADVSEETRRYYRAKVSAGERPLLFHGVPHILYKGTLDTHGLELIEPVERIEKIPLR